MKGGGYGWEAPHPEVQTKRNFNVQRFPLFLISPMTTHPTASAVPTPSAPDRNSQSFFTTGMAVIWAIALANLLFHIYFNT
jgi:hypothetical protein